MMKLPHVLFSCLWTFACLFSHSQCRVGPGHRGFSNGVGGLCFAALSSKSCLSVLSSWTSCNNINGPLNSLLCCAALVWVTSHTCTLSRSEMHAYGRGTAATQGSSKESCVRTLAAAGGWPHTQHCAANQSCKTFADDWSPATSCRPVCLSPLFACLFVCLFVYVDRLWGGLCLFSAHRLSH